MVLRYIFFSLAELKMGLDCGGKMGQFILVIINTVFLVTFKTNYLFINTFIFNDQLNDLYLKIFNMIVISFLSNVHALLWNH